MFWTSLNLHPCTGNCSTSFGADEPSQGAKRRSIDGWPSSCCFQALAYESTSAVRRVLVAAIAVIAQARKNHTQTRQTVKTQKTSWIRGRQIFRLRFLYDAICCSGMMVLVGGQPMVRLGLLCFQADDGKCWGMMWELYRFETGNAALPHKWAHGTPAST